MFKKVFLTQEFKNLRRPWIKYLRTSKNIETNRKKNPTILIARRCFSITASCKNYTCTRSLNLTNAQFCVVNKIHAKVLSVAVSFQQSRPEHLLAPNHIVIHTWRCVCSCFYARLRICLQMVATSRKQGQAVNNTATHTLFLRVACSRRQIAERRRGWIDAPHPKRISGNKVHLCDVWSVM